MFFVKLLMDMNESSGQSADDGLQVRNEQREIGQSPNVQTAEAVGATCRRDPLFIRATCQEALEEREKYGEMT